MNKRPPALSAPVGYGLLAALALLALLALLAYAGAAHAQGGNGVWTQDESADRKYRAHYIVITWPEQAGYTGAYQATFTATGTSRALRPVEADNAGNLPNTARRATFGRFGCGTVGTVTLVYGSRSASGEAATAECVDGPALSENEDEFIRRLCWRLPGCPASAVFLAPIIVAGFMLSAGVRHPAGLLGAAVAAYGVAAVFLLPNIFTLIFTLLGAGSAVIIWRMMR